MKVINKWMLPPLMGFAAAALSAAMSLILFLYGDIFIPVGRVQELFDNDAVSLTLMMTLSAFLLYGAMLLCRRLVPSADGKHGGFVALFLVGAFLAAVCSLLLAFVTDWDGAASMVMACYMMSCDIVVMIAFVLLMMLVRWLLKRVGKDGSFLDRLTWQFPLSLLWFAVVFAALLLL